MEALLNLNLIRFLDFYFAFTFFVGTVRRVGQYQTIGGLVWNGPTRWPHLLKLLTAHRMIFLTEATVAPALLALGLSLVQLLASRGVWPEASHTTDGLTVGRLIAHWPALLLAAPLGIAMLAMDIWGMVQVGQVDRPLMEKYFDQAEYWLRSNAAHVVRVVTFGIVDPRQVVNAEVQKALQSLREMLNFTLWWLTIQVALRFTFGLALWLTWAITR